ncbi:MAG: TIGR01906 family membrane protein [Chloroflexi bacterium]|nr:TIGR01906 family membrane protein [Chloroflexota bacterium]
MTDPRILGFIIRFYFALIVPFLLASAGMRLLLSEQFLQIAYQRPGFPSDIYGFTMADRLQYGPLAIDYLFNGEPIDYLAALRLPGGKCWNIQAGAADCALFSDRELRHMADVKQITTTIFALAVAVLLLSAMIAIANRCNARLQSDIRAGLRRGCLLALLSLLCLAVLSTASWDRAFDIFHELFFAEGTWRFPYSDSLIRLYPEQLFAEAAFALAMFIFLFAGLILVLLAIFERWPRRRI